MALTRETIGGGWRFPDRWFGGNRSNPRVHAAAPGPQRDQARFEREPQRPGDPYFARFFKRATGVSPTKFEKEGSYVEAKPRRPPRSESPG